MGAMGDSRALFSYTVPSLKREEWKRYLIDKQNTRHKLSDTLVDVLADHFVDLATQLVRNLRHLGLHQLAHHTHNVLAALGTRIGHIQVVQRNILYDFLLLVHLALGNGHILLRLEIEFRSIGVRSSDSFAGTGVRFDIDNIADCNSLLLDRLVDTRVEAKLLLSLCALESNQQRADGLAVAA
ncbi:hypothetical protein HG531_003498 [Fusarium graminearum]|nr:hypothetical protein HG531_003498 [Fusarium graminearum]